MSNTMNTISQSLLDEFQTDQAELRELRKHLGHVRRLLLDGLASGAAVEPGDLTAWISHTTTRRLSLAKLVSVLGEKKAAELRDMVPPTSSRRLIVCARDRPSVNRRGKPSDRTT
jgi:hypothetical protein